MTGSVRAVYRAALACALLFQNPPNPPAGQDPPAQRPPVFRGGTNFVLVDAYPQRDGRIVEGLTAADFEIREDGQPQQVELFEFVRVEPSLSESTRRDPNNQREAEQLAADPHNRVFVVYLDTLHTTVAGSHNIRGPLVDALNRIIGPNDLFGVMTPNLDPRQIVFGRRTGLCRSRPDFTQSVIGLQPVACAPYIRVCGASLTRPTACNSSNALWILPIRLPPAIGQTTCRGNRQPRSSAIS